MIETNDNSNDSGDTMMEDNNKKHKKHKISVKNLNKKKHLKKFNKNLLDELEKCCVKKPNEINENQMIEILLELSYVVLKLQ